MLLVSGFIVNSMLKILQFISVESVECLLMRMRRKKEGKMALSVHPWVGMIKLLPCSAKLLDFRYESYGFSGDLIETTTNECQHGKAGTILIVM